MIERAKRSPIWKMPIEDFKNLIASSKTYKEVLNTFGLNYHGNNHNTVKRRCVAENIDLDHFRQHAKVESTKILTRFNEPLLLEKILVKDSTYSRSHLKVRLLKEKLLKNECAICGLSNFWNEKELKLVLDHENGMSNDNRIENLRLVCPNCNSQLDTFAGKHKRAASKKNCFNCGKLLAHKSNRKFCLSCAMFKRRKIVWPSLEDLVEEISKTNRLQVAKRLGVSETAVRKMLKRLI